MKPLNEMSKTELEAKLEELKDLLDEVLDEKAMMLGQNNQHVSSKLVSKNAQKYEKEINEIHENIAVVEKLLKA